MAYLKTIVRFVTKNPPGSRYEFSPVRDERRLERSFMTAAPGSEMSVGRPGIPSRAVQSMFREGTDMSQVSSADYTYLEGQGGASEYFLNNINLDETTPVQLNVMVNVMFDVLQQTTGLLDEKRITKIYAADRANGISMDDFYQRMTSPGAAEPLRTLVSPLVGLPGVPTRPLVIVVQLEQIIGGSRRRRKSTRKSRRRNSTRKSRRR